MKKVQILFRLFLIVAFAQLLNSNATAQYCSAGSDFQNMYISRVSVGNINHPSGQGSNAYEDFTSLSTIMKQGSQYQAYVKGIYIWDYSYVNIYIDLNQDGDFDDPGENVGNTDGYGDFYVNFTIPSGTTTGNTRMRIRLFDSYSSGSPCGNTFDGEVEDYTVNLIPACASASTTDTAVCASGLPFTWNNQSITAGGTYNAILTNAASCDSFAMLNVKAVTPLDNIGLNCSLPAQTAYSVRRLSSNYIGYAMQVRRSTDDATQNIGFTASGDLDTAALKTFTGSGDGYVSVWYDQSMSGNNLTKNDINEQPRIVSGGIIDRENGRPFIRFFGVVSNSNNSLNLPAPVTTTALAIVVNKFVAGSGHDGDGFILGNNNDSYFHSLPSDSLLFAPYAGTSMLNGSVWQNSKSVPVASAVWNTTLGINSIAPQDPNSEATWDNIGSDRYTLHSTNNGGGYSELITFASPISNSDRSGVEANQGVYYHICIAPATSDMTLSICNSYTWNGTVYKASGNYTWHGTSAMGCDSIATLHLTILSIANTFTKTDATCNGASTGIINVTPASGTGPYTYRLGTTGSYGSVNSFSNLKAGKYTVFIKDAAGCSGTTEQITISQPDLLTYSFSKADAVCHNASSGSITINPTSGIPPYQYKLGLTGVYGTSNVFSNLKAANYKVYFQDANGCTNVTGIITIANAAQLTANTTITNATCYSFADGGITINPTSGTPPYQYKLGATGIYASYNTFTNLKAGNYKVYYQDARGCSNVETAPLAQFAAIDVTYNKTDVTCHGGNDGGITVAPGTTPYPPYSFRLGTVGNYGSTASYGSLVANKYKVFIKDGNGCIASSGTIVVNQPVAGCNGAAPFARQSNNATFPVSTANEALLSPNPTNNEFRLSLPALEKITTVRVLDINGKTIFTTNAESKQSLIFGRDYAPGVYLVEIINAGQITTLKAVKVR